jgi:hypothetical protein
MERKSTNDDGVQAILQAELTFRFIEYMGRSGGIKCMDVMFDWHLA